MTLAAVAGKLDLTKQALYHYFPSKESLVSHLTALLLEDEIASLLTAIEGADPRRGALGVMIRAFYDHYIDRLDAFRATYCGTQLQSTGGPQVDQDTLHEEINPTTRRLFDALEQRLSDESTSPAKRAELRRLAFSAWLAALGLMTMLGAAEATGDPLIHGDQALLETLAGVFDDAAARATQGGASSEPT